MLISVAICMTLFYVSFMFRSLGSYSLQERYKSDVQSFIVQTRAILGDDVTCLEVFKNKTIKEMQEDIDANELNSLQKLVFGQRGVNSRVYAKKVVIELSKDPTSEGRRGYYGEIRYTIDRENHIAVREQIIPFYFVIKSNKRVEKCHATVMNKDNMTLEDRVCQITDKVERYDPESNRCRKPTKL